MTQVIETELHDGIAIIRLNRPEVHNAVNDEMMGAMEAILDELEKDNSIRVVILTASGDESFCSGGDLKYFATLNTREAALQMSRRMQNILSRLYDGSRVVIAAVNGQAYGGGCEILTACHFRIAASHAKMSFRQAANGIITGWGGGVRLFQLLGQSMALRLLLTSEDLNAAEAARIGFVDQVVPESELRETALELARKIITNSAEAVASFLEIAQHLRNGSIRQAKSFESERFADLWTREDFRRWHTGFLAGSASKQEE